MTKTKFTEDSYEQALISLFRDELGYDYIYGPDIERDYRQPCYVDALEPAIRRLNPMLPAEVIEEAVKRVLYATDSTLVQSNEAFMRALQDGLEVPYMHNGDERTAIVQLIDYEHKGKDNKNTFHIANQWRVEGLDAIRCDMVVFINGMPLVVIELKSPSEEGVSVSDAYLQIRFAGKKDRLGSNRQKTAFVFGFQESADFILDQFELSLRADLVDPLEGGVREGLPLAPRRRQQEAGRDEPFQEG